MQPQALHVVDRTLGELAAKSSLIKYMSPVDSGDQKALYIEARERGEIVEPIFQYPDLGIDPSVAIKQIDELEIPTDSAIGQIINDSRCELKLSLQMLEARGDKEHLVELNQQLYGAPNNALLDYAKSVLTDNDPILDELRALPKVSSVPGKDYLGESIEVVRGELDFYTLLKWQVLREDVPSSKTDIFTTAVILAKNGSYGAQSPGKLGVHEVGVHALRGANGAKQPWDIFRRGFPGYVATEEGLAVYSEYKFGSYLNVNNYRNYAGRVAAVSAMMEGRSFSECVDELMEYNFSLPAAFQLAMRAYRGGGFAKDQEYLKGFKMIRDFVDEGGDLTDLYYGKFSLEHLALVKEMAANGELTPKDQLILPRWLRVAKSDVTRH